MKQKSLLEEEQDLMQGVGTNRPIGILTTRKRRTVMSRERPASLNTAEVNAFAETRNPRAQRTGSYLPTPPGGLLSVMRAAKQRKRLKEKNKDFEEVVEEAPPIRKVPETQKWTYNGLMMLEARTRSEARSVVKKALGTGRVDGTLLKKI